MTSFKLYLQLPLIKLFILFLMKQTNRFLAFIVVLLVTVSCSVQSKLNHQFKGETIESAKDYFSNLPYSTTPLENGNTKYVFTKEQQLSSTPISQGDATLDPIESPPTIKTEHYIFIVDKNQQIISSSYEKNYKRF